MAKKDEKTYTKKQFLSSNKFTAGQKDLLNALLEDEKTYTHQEVSGAVKKYLEQEAK